MKAHMKDDGYFPISLTFVHRADKLRRCLLGQILKTLNNREKSRGKLYYYK